MNFLAILSVVGIVTCLYVLFLQKVRASNKTYKPFCNISDKISCTKTFESSYGYFMGIPYGFIGLVFYSFMLVFALFYWYSLIFIGSIAALLASLYLAYIQYVKLQVFCILCTLVYIINLLLVLISYRRM